MFNKRGQNNNLAIGVVVAILLVLFVPALNQGVRNALGGLGGAPAAAPSGQVSLADASCIGVDSVSMTLGPASVKFVPATDLSTGNVNHRLYRNGVDQGLLNDGAAVTLAPKDKLAVYYAENATGVSSDTNLYALESKFDAPCTAFSSASVGAKPELWRNSSLTVNIFNEDDNDLNSDANNQSIGASEEVVFRVNLDGAAERAYSPYGKIVMTVEANSTEFDRSSVDASGWEPCPTPGLHENLDIANFDKSFCHKGGPEGTDKRLNIDFDLTIRARSVDPITEVAGDDMRLTFRSENWGQDPDEKVERYGVEDVDETRLGFPDNVVRISYS